MPRWAWLIFFVLGAGSALVSPVLLLGNPPDPPSAEGLTGLSLAAIGTHIPGISTYIESLSRQLGNFMLAFGVLLAAIAAGPYRRGERWAWNVLWIMPILLGVQFVNSNFGLGWQLDLGLMPITIGVLLATYRRTARSGTERSVSARDG